MSQGDVSPSQSQQPHKGVAVVTGAARGIGRGIALRLADDGFDVAVNDLPGTPELDEVIKTIEEKGRRALATPGDVSDESTVTQIVHSVVTTLGSLDVVRGTRARDIPHPPFSFLACDALLNSACCRWWPMQAW
jgi:NAD(P)-dependent dehydrogenase (short-subunit alcohol dehydrogenase family)